MNVANNFTSFKADNLATDIRSRLKDAPISWSVEWESPLALQKLLTKRLTKEEKQWVVLSVSDGKLFISISNKPKSALPQTKASNLKSLLRKCLVHIDDENLYDEVMKVIYDN